MSAEIRTIVVDDSALFRILMRDILNQLPNVRVVASAKNGLEALEQISKHQPDFVTLDVEMPEMDGIETLRALRQRDIKTRVVMVSRHTASGAVATTDALLEGAYDFILKPTGADPGTNRAELKTALQEKISGLSGTVPVETSPSAAQAFARVGADNHLSAVVIATSTGGPEALRKVIPALSGNLPVPVLIVQHMPSGFTARLAQRLDSLSALNVAEAVEGETLRAGTVLIAPGGRHTCLKPDVSGDVVITLSDDPPEHGCRPSADYLLRSAVNVFGGEILAVVLTGMGNDGTQGCTIAKENGAHIIAQDQASSVVFGMPRSIIRHQLADEVVDLNAVAARIHAALGMQ